MRVERDDFWREKEVELESLSGTIKLEARRPNASSERPRPSPISASSIESAPEEATASSSPSNVSSEVESLIHFKAIRALVDA